VYGFTDAIVGTFERMRNVGIISNSDAITTATTVATLKNTHRRSHARCQLIEIKRAMGDGRSAVLEACTGVSSPTANRPPPIAPNGAARITGSSYTAGLVRHVIRMFQPNISMPTM
jgi:hypothetical protein